MTHRPSGNARPDSSVAPNRFWTAPDGTLWRVWLEPAVRHQLRRGEARPVLAFVGMGVEPQTRSRVVAPTETNYREKPMPTYRVKFRTDKEDQLIKANSMADSGTSYVFYSRDNDLVAQVPKDAALTVVEENAEG